jgi:hypothetical protein
MKSARALSRIGIIAAIISLGGCAAMDPFERPGLWQPMGANDLNRELQVARPTDLVLGRGTSDSEGFTAANAVDRLIRDRVRQLPNTTITTVGGSGGNTSGGTGGTGSGP